MDKLKDTLDNLSLTNDEAKRLTDAFKKEEFRKLFIEYAQELQDPENKKLYEEELKAMENERGMDVEFINPLPGHVLKTIQNSEKKIFINICQSDKVEKASSNVSKQNKALGTNWSIPHSFSPPREDIDKKKDACLIYDVVFHPETYEMSTKNLRFRKMLQDTAMEGLEKSFNVNIDKVNFKILKMKMKGAPTATVIRRKRADFADKQAEINKTDDPLKFPYPNAPEETKKKSYVISEKTVEQNKDKSANTYTKPQYKLKYSDNFNILNYVGETVKYQTRPEKMIVEIKLPLLSTANAVDLDINRQHLKLSTERPAKYLLELKLSYPVVPDKANAKFDKSRRLLILTLPIEAVVADDIQESVAEEQKKSLVEEEKDAEDSDDMGETANVSTSSEVSCENVENELDHGLSKKQNSNVPRSIPQLTPHFRNNSRFIFALIMVKNVLATECTCECISITANGWCDLLLQFANAGQGGWQTLYELPISVQLSATDQKSDSGAALAEAVQCDVGPDNMVVRIPLLVAGVESVLAVEILGHTHELKGSEPWKPESVRRQAESANDDDDVEEENVNYKVVTKRLCRDHLELEILPEDYESPEDEQYDTESMMEDFSSQSENVDKAQNTDVLYELSTQAEIGPEQDQLSFTVTAGEPATRLEETVLGAISSSSEPSTVEPLQSAIQKTSEPPRDLVADMFSGNKSQEPNKVVELNCELLFDLE